MDVSLWKELVRGSNKDMDESVVLLPLDATLLEAEVEVVLEEVFVL